MIELKAAKNDLEAIKEHGEICCARAEQIMIDNNLSFDDVERINEHSENHNWGSNSDRAYRKRAIKKAVLKIASNPKKYIRV